MIHARQTTDLAQELFQNGRRNSRLGERYWRSDSQDDILGRGGVGREQSPVDVGAITHVGRVAVFRCGLQDALDDGLCRIRLFEE